MMTWMVMHTDWDYGPKWGGPGLKHGIPPGQKAHYFLPDGQNPDGYLHEPWKHYPLCRLEADELQRQEWKHIQHQQFETTDVFPHCERCEQLLTARQRGQLIGIDAA